MESRIKKLFSENKNWEFVDELEKEIDCGIEVITERSNKIIHKADSKYKIVIRIRVKNKTEYKILHSKIMAGIGNFNIEKNNFVVFNENTGDYYGEHTGFTNASVRNTDNDFVLSYTKKQMEKITSLKDEYENRIKAYEEIGELFNIDCKKYYCSENTIARAIASKCMRCFDGCEHVSSKEYDFIDGACQGGLLYCKKGVFENCLKMDLNSAYPFAMQNDDFYFPMTVGSFKTISKIDTTQVGIYRLRINGDHFLFKKTKDNYYTTYHLEILDLLGIPYELENGVNALIWEETLKGKNAFGYMNNLFDMKAKGNKYAKAIMNVTWGSLTREKLVEIKLSELKEDQKPFVQKLDMDKQIALVMLDRNNWIIKAPHPYKFVTGRIKPFITSFVRLFLIKNILLPLHKANHKIYQINTDGFVTSATKEQIEQIYPVSSSFGHLKVEEEYKEFEIINLRKIISI